MKMQTEAPQKQAATLQGKGKKILAASLKKIAADQPLIRVINWGFITLLLASLGIFIGINLVADILMTDWEAALCFLLSLLLAGILAYVKIYKCLCASTHCSADAVYLFSLMNLFYHFLFLFWAILTVDAYIFHEYLKNHGYLGATAFFCLMTGLVILLIIPIFFKYQHGYKNIGFKSGLVFFFKWPFVLPIWIFQAIFYDMKTGAQSIKNRLSRKPH